MRPNLNPIPLKHVHHFNPIETEAQMFTTALQSEALIILWAHTWTLDNGSTIPRWFQ